MSRGHGKNPGFIGGERRPLQVLPKLPYSHPPILRCQALRWLQSCQLLCCLTQAAVGRFPGGPGTVCASGHGGGSVPCAGHIDVQYA